MRAAVIALLVCLFCSLTLAQMTFTDQWSKKNVPLQSPVQEPSCVESPMEYLAKLRWIRELEQQTIQQMKACLKQ